MPSSKMWKAPTKSSMLSSVLRQKAAWWTTPSPKPSSNNSPKRSRIPRPASGSTDRGPYIANILRKGNTPQRPDRVMERNGETVVIDYKFGAPHRRHHEQVQHYCHLLSRMGRRNVRGYVWYVYADRVKSVDLTT